MEKMFLRVSDVEEILGVSQSYAYKLIRRLNKEMEALGFTTIQGRIDTKFFYEHFYQTKNYERGNA
ncbi:MAG: DNA-binding protein [Pseudobutyrivibrio sp.]|nr:DNA-binding protein [Pseudobutyrivibrio sp.]